MKKILAVVSLAIAASATYGQTISNVYVSASTSTTATIVWTTSTPAKSQIRYGLDNTLPFSNNTNYALVTSHSMTLTLLNAAQPYYFAVVSVDGGGHSTQSSTYEFALCGQGIVPATGTVNLFYGFGTATLTWVPPAGASGSPTICGQPVQTTMTATLSQMGSFSTSVADAYKVTPGPGTWTVAVADIGDIAPISITEPLSVANQDVSVPLQAAAAGAGLTWFYGNMITHATYPSIAPLFGLPTNNPTFTGTITGPQYVLGTSPFVSSTDGTGSQVVTKTPSGACAIASGCTGATTPSAALANLFAGPVISIHNSQCGGVVNGTTDDTAAWTACIAIASAQNGTVTTDGLSLLKSTPTIPSAGNFRIQGTTPGAGMYFSNPAGFPNTTVSPWLYGSVINAGLFFPTGTSNVEIDHMNLTCDPSTSTGCRQVVFLLDDNNINLHDNHYSGGWGGTGSNIDLQGGHDLTFKDSTGTGYYTAAVLTNDSSGLVGAPLRVHVQNFTASGGNPASTNDPTPFIFFDTQFSDLTDSTIDQGNVPVQPGTGGSYGAGFYTVSNTSLRILSLTGKGPTMAATVPGSAPVSVSSASGNGTTLTLNLGTPIFAGVPSPAASPVGGISGITCGSGSLPSGAYYTITGTSQVTIPASCASPTLSSAVFWMYGYLPDIGQSFYVNLLGVLNGTGAPISSLSYTYPYITSTISTGHFSPLNAGIFSCSLAGITVPTVPTVTANIVAGAITSYTVNTGGANATIDYTIVVTDPTGTGATVGAQTFNSSGALTALGTGLITGTGYTNPTVTLTGGDGLSGAYGCQIASVAPDTFTVQAQLGLHATIPAGAVSSAVMQTTLSGPVMATVTGYGAFSFDLEGGDSAGVNLSNAITAISGTTTITVTVGAGLLPPVGTQFRDLITGVTGGSLLNGGWVVTVTSPTTFTFTNAGSTAVGASVSGAYSVAEAYIYSAFDVSKGNTYKNTGGSGLYLQGCDYCSSKNDQFFNIDQQEQDTTLPAGGVAINNGIGAQIVGDSVVGSGQNCYEAESVYGLVFSGNYCENPKEAGIKLSVVFGYTIGDYKQRGTSRYGFYATGPVSGTTGLMDIEGSSAIAINPAGSGSTLLKFGGPTRVANGSGYCLMDDTTGSSYANLDCNGLPILLSGVNQAFDSLHIENIARGFAIALQGATSPHFNNLTAANIWSLFYTQGNTTDLEVNVANLSGILGGTYQDQGPGYVIGTTTNNSYVISSMPSASTLTVGDIVSDSVSFSGSGYIPAGTTVMSINSGSGCSSNCVVMSQKATGAASGETIAVFGSILTGLKWYNVTTSGTAGQGFVSYSTQGIDMQGGSFTGFAGASNGSVDFSGVSGVLAGNSVQGVTIVGGYIGLGVAQQVSNLTAFNNTISGAILTGISDQTSNLGNSYLGNILKGNPTPTTITNVNAVVGGNVAGEGTGTPTSAGIPCNAASVTNLYYQASSGSGRQSWMCDPVTVAWVQVPAPSAATSGTVTSVDGSASEGVETAVAGAVAAITTSGIVRGAFPYLVETGGVTLTEAMRGHFIVTSDSGNDVYVLPTPSGTSLQNGWYIEVKNTGTGTVTLTPAGSTTIDGQTTVVLPAKTSIKFQSDGTNYHSMMISPGSSNAQNLVYASPAAATGPPSMRALVGTDIPAINLAASGPGGVTGTLPTGNGGTGEAGTITGVAFHNGASADTAATTAQLQTAIGSGVYAPITNAPSALISVAPTSDILCASGNNSWPNSKNVSIAPLAVSNIIYSAPTFTFTVASGLKTDGYIVGQTVQITSTTGGTGNFNVSDYAITAVTSQTSFTATSATATGTAYGSGGTLSMVCNNSSDDLTVAPFASTLPLPIMSTYTRFAVEADFSVFTAATAPNVQVPRLYYNNNVLVIGSAALTLPASSVANLGGSYYTFTSQSSGLVDGVFKSQTLSTTPEYSNSYGVQYISTAARYNLALEDFFSASGLGGTLALTYSTGGLTCTNGTQTVGTFNGAGTGGTGTITVSGNIPSGAITFTNPGYGYTSIPTTAQVATCTGLTTFTNTGALGGAGQTALRLISFTAKQQ